MFLPRSVRKVAQTSSAVPKSCIPVPLSASSDRRSSEIGEVSNNRSLLDVEERSAKYAVEGPPVGAGSGAGLVEREAGVGLLGQKAIESRLGREAVSGSSELQSLVEAPGRGGGSRLRRPAEVEGGLQADLRAAREKSPAEFGSCDSTANFDEIRKSVVPGFEVGELKQLGESPGLVDEHHEAVKARSIQQRQPKPGEPNCAVCGRYGEYICDETDDDVCSLECKSIILAEKTKPPADVLPATVPKEKLLKSNIILQDECILVTDKKIKLPEWMPDSSITKLSQQQVDALLLGIEVSIKGKNPPRPILQFSDCNFYPKIQENLEIAGYDTPTPVQMQAIPAALKGRDVLVSADTGTGKTASFLLPILMRCCLIRIHGLSNQKKPLAMVLTPTRELCAQVEEQAKVLAKGLPFKTALVVGGEAMPQQLHRMKQGVELIIATPGRLIDLLSKHDIDLEDVCILALDEVDCMLESGFRDQVLQLVQALSNPQVLMYSATIPPSIEKFSSTILKNPLVVSVGTPSQPNSAVQQMVMWVESRNKKKKLFDILRSRTHFRPPIVVFVNSRMGSDLLAEAIRTITGIKAVSLHGEKPMKERRETMKHFLTGDLPVLVATGVMGRGLDLVRVTQVIIFDFPSSIQEYIHMIGRASRLGHPGSAMVFIDNESKALFKELMVLLRSSGTAIPHELLNSPYVHSTYALAYNRKKRKKQDADFDSD